MAASKEPPAEICENSKRPGKLGQSFSPTLNFVSKLLVIRLGADFFK